MNECSRANYSRARIPIRTRGSENTACWQLLHQRHLSLSKGNVRRVDALGLGSQQTCSSRIPERSRRCYIQPLLWIAERDGNWLQVSGAEGDGWARDGDPLCIHGLGCSFFLAGRATRIHLQSKASTAGAGQGPLQGWVLLPKCRHLLGSGVGEGVCLSGNDRDREKGFPGDEWQER